MFFIDKDFLIFSSHKTGTQTLINTFNQNGYKCGFCHRLINFKHHKKYIDFNYNDLKQNFLNVIQKYYTQNNKKIKIISVIRNPLQRLPSSFFQILYNDYIKFFNYNPDETPIQTENIEKLLKIFYEGLFQEETPGLIESIDELSDILEVNIIEECTKKDDHYYFENDLVQIYILDFKRIIDENSLNYLNNILDINLTLMSERNLAKNKPYYEKYIEFKSKIPEDTKEAISKMYNNFYFTAFEE